MKEIFEQINNAELSDRHISEGSENPTTECRSFAIEVANKLYTLYRLVPLYASATVEDGIYLSYRKESKKLCVEVYNDLDIAALVSTDSDILGSFDIHKLDFKKVIDLF